MNWLAKKAWRLMMSVAILFIFFSCKKDNSLGYELQPEDLPLGVVLTDTITAQAFTLQNNDSIISDNTGYLIAGAYTDPFLGKVYASAFTQIHIATENQNLGSNAFADSVKLNLRYDYSYGDTTQFQTLNIHRLTGPLLDNNYYTNSGGQNYDPTVLGSVTFKATKDPVKSYIEVVLPASFGNEILYGPQNNAAFVTSNYGFALIPGDNSSGCVLRFDISNARAILRVYYHNDASNGLFYDLRPNTTMNRYYNINADRSGTALSTIDQNKDTLNSNLSSNRYFIQAGTGLNGKITFPGIYNLKNAVSGYLSVNQADLIVPVDVSDLAKYPMTERIAAYPIDKNDKVITNLSVSVSSIFDPVNNQFVISVKEIVQDIINKKNGAVGIVLMPRSERDLGSGQIEYTDITSVRVSRFVLENDPVGKKPKLNLYYTVIP